MIYSLDHVQLSMPAGGEEQARAFYGALLQLAEVAKPVELAANGGCWFQIGPTGLHLGVEAEFRPARKAHPGLLVDDLDGTRRRLTDAGYDCGEISAVGGVLRLHTHDPFGNRIEFQQVRAVGDFRGEQDRRL